MVKIPPKNKLKITVGENMKKYIKNVTDDNKTVYDPLLGRPYSPATLSFKEGGKIITLKPGESVETKLDGSSLAGYYVNGKKQYKRLQLVTEEEIKNKKNITRR